MRALLKTFIVAVLVSLYTATPAYADEIRPALLDIKQQNTGLFAVTWKVPTRGDKVLAITPQLPDSLELLGTPTLQQAPGAQIEHATYKSNGESLTGQMITIEGLTAVQTDVLLLIQLQDGTQHSAILRPSAPQFTIPLEASKLQVAGDYWRMGTIHILEGVDHLLFVFGLLLLSGRLRLLIETVTSFTVGHSLTLSLCALDWLRIPSGPAEVAIAASLLLLAVELARGPEQPVTWMRRRPWLMAMSFGLLHGLGFAGALRELGLPQEELLTALFSFNLGIEIGQLAFIGAVLFLGWAAVRAFGRGSSEPLIADISNASVLALPKGVQWIPVYGMGTLSAYWFWVRTATWMGAGGV